MGSSRYLSGPIFSTTGIKGLKDHQDWGEALNVIRIYLLYFNSSVRPDSYRDRYSPQLGLRDWRNHHGWGEALNVVRIDLLYFNSSVRPDSYRDRYSPQLGLRN